MTGVSVVGQAARVNCCWRLVRAFLLRLQALCLDPRRSFWGDVEMTEVDVPMLMRGQRLDNAFAFGSGGSYADRSAQPL
jgi:hypothetical protein